MTKYLFSRLMLIFLISFFTTWAFNFNHQMEYFFGWQLKMYVEFFGYIVSTLILALGLVTIVGIFFIKDCKFNTEAYNMLIEKGVLGSMEDFFRNFFEILNDTFNKEFDTDLYPKHFIAFAFISLIIFQGNPLFNNYHGITKDIFVDEAGQGGDESHYEKEIDYIFPKYEIGDINRRISELEYEIRNEEPLSSIDKRGYLFMQSGLIAGYTSPYYDYVGFWSYFGSLFFLAIEKFINAIIFFLIPFSASIIISKINDFKTAEKRKDLFYNHYR